MNIQQPNHSVGPQRGSTSSLKLSSRKIGALARTSRFVIRRGKKLCPAVFLKALVVCVATGRCTFRELATEIGLLTGESISRQGLWQRTGARAGAFVRAAVAETLRLSARSVLSLKLHRLPGVERILVGDSSTFTLHPSLREEYPGSTNQHGVATAQCRLQLTFDLLSGKWLHARLDPYKRNDRRAAWDIIEGVVKKGDLIVRDLGYAVSACFEAIANKGAFFLSRLNTTATVLDEQGRPLELLALVREKAPRAGDHYSLSILLSKSVALPCRLVIVNEGEAVGNVRRRRLADQGKRQGITHTKAYRLLQNWTLLVTNLPCENASDRQLRELYMLRWRIENIFKLAKSHTAIKKIAAHNSNVHHLEVMIWGWMLMMIELSMRGVFALAQIRPALPGAPLDERHLAFLEHSIFKAIEKLIDWMALSMELFAAGSIAELHRRFIEQCHYHDRYDKRHDRTSIPRRLYDALINPTKITSLS